MEAKNLPADVVNVLIESENGVTEIVLRVSKADNTVAMLPIGIKIASGTLKPVSTKQLLEALQLTDWSEDHPEVFEEGRVSA